MADKNEGTGFANWVGNVVTVITNDGRVVKGILRGYDQTTNVVVEDCCELVFSTTSGVQQAEMGLQVFRGDNVAIVGEVDEDGYDAADLDNIRAAPLKPIGH